MTIEPANPGSLALVRELLAELLPLFTSRRVHVGLDEAWELPSEPHGRLPGLGGHACARCPSSTGREMLMWGDMVSGRADLVAALPDGVTVCEWGYDDWYPFDERCAVLADAGRAVLGRPGDLELAEHPRPAHATPAPPAVGPRPRRWPTGRPGYLNTDWGDNGHLQQWVISEPGLAFGAAVSWCLEPTRISTWRRH